MMIPGVEEGWEEIRVRVRGATSASWVKKDLSEEVARAEA